MAKTLYEMLYERMENRNVRQADLCRGLCSTSAMSRYLRGERRIDRMLLTAFMQRLGMSPDKFTTLLTEPEYYFSSIETSDYSVLEKKHNLERLIMCENWEDAERELYSLEKALSLDIPVNSQYVRIMKYIIDNDLDKIEPKDKIEILRQILSMTVTDIPESDCVEAWGDDIWLKDFSSIEILIIVQIGNALINNKDYKLAAHIFENVLEGCKRSRIKPEFHYRTLTLIISRLSGLYGRLGDCERERSYSLESIRISSVSCNRDDLPAYINNLADAYEKMGDMEKAAKYYRIAYLCAELFGKKYVHKIKASYDKIKEVIFSIHLK